MPRPRFTVIAGAVTAVVAVGVALATGAATAGGLHWQLGLAEHFRLHYLVLAVLTAGAATARRDVRVADVAALVALVNLAAVVLPPAPRPRPAGPPHRVVSINVHTGNRDHAAVARFIDRTRPEVLVLLEVDAAWLADLAAVTADYPVRTEVPRDDNFGIALYARGRAAAAEVHWLEGLPTITATVSVATRPWRVIATHPLPPASAAIAATAARQRAGLATLARDRAGPTILIGDLNATPWSRAFEELCAASGLRDSRPGFGNQATWPSGLGWAGIPIDHALVSADLAVVDRWVGPDVGSDHRPLVVDLADAR